MAITRGDKIPDPNSCRGCTGGTGGLCPNCERSQGDGDGVERNPPQK